MRGLSIGLSIANKAGAGSDPYAAYAANGFTPEVIADFANETYRDNASNTAFDDMFTYTGDSLKTMVDSDGALKWAPHNLARQSENFSLGAVWLPGGSGISITADAAVAPDGNTTADRAVDASGISVLYQIISVTAGAKYTMAFWAKNNGGTNAAYRVYDVSNAADIVAMGTSYFSSINDSTWTLVSVEFTAPAGCSQIYAYPLAIASGADFDIFLWGFHVYRSDLGGMVNNPNRGDSYVPTTSAAVYMPRRGSYVYNGTSWVNRGIFLESEPSTNLITSSDDMSGWTNSNTTDAKTQTGPGGNANGATLVSATAGNGTILLTVTAASNPHTYSALVKRVTGTGTIEMTVNGGSTWVDVTSDINSSVFTQVGTGAGVTVTNPQVGFRIVTSGDEIAVAVNQLEQTSGQFSSPMPTTGATLTRAAETLTIAAANMAYSSTAMSFAMDGLVTYADEGAAAQQTFFRWQADASNYISIDLDTDSTDTGQVNANQSASATLDTVVAAAQYSPGVNVAFNVASRNTSGAINVAKDGTAATADTTPTALPALGSTAFSAGYDFTGHISQFRQWAADIGDTGIEEASA